MEENLEKDSQQTNPNEAPVPPREHLCPIDHRDEVWLLEIVMPIRKNRREQHPPAQKQTQDSDISVYNYESFCLNPPFPILFMFCVLNV